MLRIDEKTGYSDTWDAFYDRETGKWLEEKCNDPECLFCHNRPEKYPVKDKDTVQ